MKSAIYDLAVGAALVALGYALYQHFKGGSGATTGLPATMPTAGTPANSYDAANPGKVVSLADLLAGAVHDFVGTGTTSTPIPTTEDIFSSVTGYTPPDSVVKVNPWL